MYTSSYIYLQNKRKQIEFKFTRDISVQQDGPYFFVEVQRYDFCGVAVSLRLLQLAVRHVKLFLALLTVRLG